MAAGRNLHLALYGNVPMLRGYCPDCETYCFVIDNRRQCCDGYFNVPKNGPKKVKRISEPEQKRRSISAHKKKKLLQEQDYRCLYCNRRFGSTVIYKGKPTTLRVHWDHMTPYAYSQNNSVDNYAPVCHVCNSWKNDKMFKSIEEIQLYVAQKIAGIG